MKNIHVLSTDKSSRLHTYKGVLNLAADEFVAPTIVKNDLINLNIYITSDLEIKEGDWIFNEELEPSVLKCSGQGSLRGWNKIILTTDIDLIKDDVQAIDDEFLEWFVKNPSFEFVEVKKGFADGSAYGYDFLSYKIIIPQEEPKQETTLEKAAEIYANKKGNIPTTKLEDAIFKQGFIDGAKWQQEKQDCCTPANQIKRYVDCIGCDRKPKQMSKQTAVDYLFNELIANPGNFIKAYKQAKEMEKEQIIEAHGAKQYHKAVNGEQYYNETYKKEEK
jgi:hypothetical protein